MDTLFINVFYQRIQRKETNSAGNVFKCAQKPEEKSREKHGEKRRQRSARDTPTIQAEDAPATPARDTPPQSHTEAPPRAKAGIPGKPNNPNPPRLRLLIQLTQATADSRKQAEKRRHAERRLYNHGRAERRKTRGFSMHQPLRKRGPPWKSARFARTGTTSSPL